MFMFQLRHDPFSDLISHSGYQALTVSGVCSEPDYPVIFLKEILAPVGKTSTENRTA